MKNPSINTYKAIAILLAVLATMMMLMPALIAIESESEFTGIQIVFGYEFMSLGSLASGTIVFSLLNMLAYTLPLFAIAALLVSQHGFILSSAIFLMATVMLLSIPDFTVVTVTILDNVNEVTVDWAYGYGLIIAIIAACSGFLISLIVILNKTAR